MPLKIAVDCQWQHCRFAYAKLIAFSGIEREKVVKKRFQNPPGQNRLQRDWKMGGSFLFKHIKQKVPKIPTGHVLSNEQALAQLDTPGDRLTWMGHATFLVRLGGVNILTDPFFSNYASPIQGLGPKRFVPPGLAIEQLPPIDIILVSHNHYDHLDKPALKKISNKKSIQVVVPLGLAVFFKRLGFQHIHELDWHESCVIKSLTIRALPAMHFSRRGLFDYNKTLWASFSIESPGQKLFFSGDTAYGEFFKQLGKDYGPFDYGLMAIGAYQPREIMSRVHVTPEEAVKIAEDLKVKTIVGMHWGTIMLTTEPPFEPPVLLRKYASEAAFAEQDVWVMKIGETKMIGHNE